MPTPPAPTAAGHGEERLREADLARVLLVQACEEADPEGRFLPSGKREEAGRSAATAAAKGPHEEERFLAARANELTSSLTARWPVLRHALWLAAVPVAAPLIVLLALAAGLVLDRLGDVRRINLLAFPLLGLIAWNFAIYLVLAVEHGVGGRGREARTGGRLAVGLIHVATWLASPDRWWAQPRSADAVRWLGTALRRFLHRWIAIAGGLVRARGERALHLGAAAFAIGAVLGMYLRGLAFEYHAGWESTFLGAPAVSLLLSIVLGPAARIAHALAPGVAPSPDQLFSIDSLERLRGPQAAGEAAIWIHLWGITTVLAVVAPRLLLAWKAQQHARRLAADLSLPLHDPYYLRLLAPGRGAGVRIDVVPYSYRPTKGQIERVRSLLLDLLGGRIQFHLAEPVGYGAEPGPVPSGEAGAAGSRSATVVVFNLAQSPEPETHGAYLDAVRRDIGGPGGGSLLVLLDEEAYQARIGGEPGRIAERRRAWQRLVGEHGLVAVPVAPGSGQPDDALLGALRAALRSAAVGPGAA
jgi:hypothetical protein